MNRIFGWWFCWALGFNLSVLGAAMGLNHVLSGVEPLRGSIVGVVGAAIAIALAAVAIAKMRSGR